MLLHMMMMNTMFNWHNQWYPIAIQKFVDKSKPFKSTVLDTPIVTWYDKNINYWNTIIDRCPHRGAPLSEGRIENGNIQCPYHGYQFNGCGECKFIPQLRNNTDLSKMDTNAMITTVSEDIIWIWMNSSTFPTCDPPRYIKSDDDLDTYFIEDYMTDVPFDFRYLQENIMDVSHTSFTHHGTQSNRKFATPIDYQITSNIDINGFEMISKNYPDEDFTRYNRFIAPSFHVTSIQRTIFGITLNNTLVTYALPISNGKSKVISRFMLEGTSFNHVLRFISSFIPQWYRHLMVNEFVEDDIIMLNRMQNYNTKNNKYTLLASSDTPVLMWNRWLFLYGNYSNLLVPTKLDYKSNLQLLDRYDRHTKNCLVCVKAKSRLKLYRHMLYMLLVYMMIQKHVIMSICIVNIIMILSGTIKRFDTGLYPPKRNM